MRGKTGILTVLVVLLSACATPSEPETLAPVESPAPTATPLTSPGPSPTIQASVDKSVAEAFLSEYLDAANAALADAEAMPGWRQRFSESCSVCKAGYRSASAIYTEGHRIVGGGLVDRSVRVEDSAEGQATFMVSGTVAAAQVLASDGSTVDTFDAEEDIAVVYTVRRQPSGSWLVIGGELLG